jgi:hypothetical protein
MPKAPKNPNFGARFRRYANPGEKVTVVPPRGPLCQEDLDENYTFRLGEREHERDDPVELVDRVRRGVKPMATILLRCDRHIHLSTRCLKKVADMMGLCCQVVNPRENRTEGVVYQKGLTLGDFYPKEEIIARYRGAGIHMPLALLETPLETFACSLSKEAFTPAHLKYPVMGLCFGYPVDSTLDLIRKL